MRHEFTWFTVEKRSGVSPSQPASTTRLMGKARSYLCPELPYSPSDQHRDDVSSEQAARGAVSLRRTARGDLHHGQSVRLVRITVVLEERLYRKPSIRRAHSTGSPGDSLSHTVSLYRSPSTQSRRRAAKADNGVSALLRLPLPRRHSLRLDATSKRRSAHSLLRLGERPPSLVGLPYPLGLRSIRVSVSL